MTLTIWLSLLLICLLGAASPGPSLAMVMRHTLSRGAIAGLICAWAHAIGIALYALLTLMGLALALQQSPVLFNALTLAGAGYLGWLGWQALQSNGTSQTYANKAQVVSYWRAATDGLAISLFNPKILLFFLALFSQFVTAADNHTGRILLLATPALVDGLWYSLIALTLSRPGIVSRLRHHSALIDKLSGIVLILLALRVIYTLLTATE